MRHLIRKAGLDDQVVPTLLFRCWNVIGGAASVLLLPLWLNPTEQGYYYTFGSVLALQIFFELGLNQIIVQLVSHEVAHLAFDERGNLHGEAQRLDRLSSLGRLIRRWYAFAAFGFLLFAGGTGVLFFERKGTMPLSAWLGVWILLILSTAANLLLSPRLAMLEGCGKIGSVARLRLVQSMVGYTALWALLFSGAGLWVAAAVPAASSVCTYWWLRRKGDLLRALALRPIGNGSSINWRSDVLPLQWRIAVSWISGYFMQSIITPFVFAHRGAVEAGQYGMALNIFSAISSIGMSWVFAKAPTFAMLISRGARPELDALFRSVAIRSTVVTTLLSLMFVAGIWSFGQFAPHAVARIAPVSALLCLAIVTAANSAIFAVAVYMRAHKEEPLLLQSMVTGLLTAVALYIGSGIGLRTMTALQAMLVLLVPMPWSLWLFRGYLRRGR
jgi:hypothetical protein